VIHLKPQIFQQDKKMMQISLTVQVLSVAIYSRLFALSNGLSSTSTVFDMHSSVARSMPTTEQSNLPRPGVEIEMPDFDELFGRIQQVSPLARAAIEQSGPFEKQELFSADDAFEWTKQEANGKKLVSCVDKIDDFQSLKCPILRFRASLEGPCIGDAFVSLIMDLEERSKWDPSIKEVYEAYPIRDLDAANIQMGFGKYGDCSRLGVGYCQTKSYLAVPGREQLTLCGVQNFEDGSSLIWGTEMEDWHNHLLPPGKRTTRARSHLFFHCPYSNW